MAFEDEPLQLEATAPAAHWNARVMVDGAGLFKAVWGLTKAHLAGGQEATVDAELGSACMDWGVMASCREGEIALLQQTCAG